MIRKTKRCRIKSRLLITPNLRKLGFIMKKYVFGILSAAILVLSFILCRCVFFDLHGMKDWPVVLLVLGGLVIVAATLFKCKYIPLFTAIGYPLAFIAGVIFQTDYVAASTNNLWIIWTVAYLCFIAVGVVIEIIKRKNQASSKN